MKTLELNQMENLEGGTWQGCAGGAVGLSYAYVNSGAAFLGGWWGLAAAAVVGCVVGALGTSDS